MYSLNPVYIYAPSECIIFQCISKHSKAISYLFWTQKWRRFTTYGTQKTSLPTWKVSLFFIEKTMNVRGYLRVARITGFSFSVALSTKSKFEKRSFIYQTGENGTHFCGTSTIPLVTGVHPLLTAVLRTQATTGTWTSGSYPIIKPTGKSQHSCVWQSPCFEMPKVELTWITSTGCLSLL